MRAIRYHEHGGPDVLQIDEVERPVLGEEELLVEVAASSVNPLDTHLRNGWYEPAALPMIPGVDLAGTVVATGSTVDGYAEGDRVFGTGIGRDRMGAHAEYAVVPVDLAAHLPDGVPFSIAGAVGNVGVTAWVGLFDHGGLRPGDVCLVHGGNGGVGHIAVQLAALTHAEVIATAVPAYHDRLRQLGADVVLDYRRDDLKGAVGEAAPGGMDVILEHRLDDYLQFDIDVAATGGRIVSIGGRRGVMSDPATARAKDVRLQAMSMFNAPAIGAVLERLGSLLDTGDLSVEIGRTYGFGSVAEAHHAVLDDSYLGKLVLEGGW